MIRGRSLGAPWRHCHLAYRMPWFIPFPGIRLTTGRGMEVLFLDNGLISKGEHSYSLVKTVGAALSRRGLSHRIFAAKVVDPSIAAEIGAIPHFRRSLYDNESPFFTLPAWMKGRSSKRAISERRSARLLNAAFEQDLAALPGDIWSPATLVVVPGLSQNQILGLVRALVAKPESARPRTICQLMFPPEWTPWGRTARMGQKIYRKAFRNAAPLVGKSLFFTAENEAIAALYRELYGIEAQILPVPFGGTRPAKPGTARPTFGFLGYSKCDKGFHLLPQAIEICRESGVAADFAIQVRHDGWEAPTVAAEQALRRMEGIRLIAGVLNEDDFIDETDRIDAMLLPYDPLLFGLRGSGLFTQSVAAGRPVVASAGTFAGAEIARGAAEGEVFSPYEAPALAAAILRLASRIEASRIRAAKLAEAFARDHSADAYVDVLLAHTAS
jgi:glycosyltransferase involved in cell wall biosynthesis